MKKLVKAASLVVASALVLTFALTAFAAGDGKSQLKMPTLKIAKVSKAIKIDGKANDKAWAKCKNLASLMGSGHYMDQSKSPAVIMKGIPAGAAKVKVLKILWDPKALYVYIQIADNTPYEDPTHVSNSDSVEYHIDAKNLDKTAYNPNSKNEGQYRLTRQGFITGWGSFSRAAFKVDSKCIATASGYQQEIKIRWANHGISKMTKGKKIGFDIQVNDATAAASGRRYSIVWNSEDNAWTNPATMGTLLTK